MNLEKYKDIFGKPNEGLRTIRIPIFNWALIDVTIVAGITWIAYMYEYTSCWYPMFVALFLVGQLFHNMFGVKTAFMRQISVVISNNSYVVNDK